LGAGELAAQELDESAGAGAAVGAQEAHPVEEDEELEDFGVLGMAESVLRGGLFGFGEEGGDGIVEAALEGRGRRLFVDDAGSEGFVSFGEGLQGGEDVGIGGGGLRGTEFCHGEGDGGKKLRVEADKIGSEADVEQPGVGGNLAGVSFFVAVGGEEIGAVGRAVESDFAFGAAADGADFFGFGRAEAFGLTFLADGTRHKRPLG